MPLFALDPVPASLHDPDWEASSYKGQCFVSAPDEATARTIAVAEFLVAPRPSAAGPMRRSPWDQPRLVVVAQVIGAGGVIPPEGTVFIAGVPLPPNAVRLATRLLAVFGESVEMTVAMRIDELADAGDEEGARRWRAVLAAMDKIRRAPAPGERRH